MKNLLDPDARLFGLRLWRKRLSDAEYVERIRKNLRRSRWARYFSAAAAVAMVLLALVMIDAFMKILANPPLPALQQNLVFGVFSLAVIVGLVVGFYLVSVVETAMRAIVEERTSRLLVDCWDALDRLLTEQRRSDKLQATESIRPGDAIQPITE